MKQQLVLIPYMHVQVSGSGERASLNIRAKIVAGPKALLDRHAFLMLSKEEAEGLIQKLQSALAQV